MATARTSAAPTAVRSPSISSRPPGGTTELPSRRRSSTSRPTSSSNRSSSRSQPNEPPPVSSQAALAQVGKRDFETSNLVRRSSSRRSNSRDGEDGTQRRYNVPSPTQYRERHRTNSARNSIEMSPTPAMTGNAATAPTQSESHSAYADRTDRGASSAHPPVARRRTSITTSTGTWALGKTIGQGSMGKVKLAKNVETGEQVSWLKQKSPSFFGFWY